MQLLGGAGRHAERLGARAAVRGAACCGAAVAKPGAASSATAG